MLRHSQQVDREAGNSNFKSESSVLPLCPVTIHKVISDKPFLTKLAKEVLKNLIRIVAYYPFRFVPSFNEMEGPNTALIAC